AMQETIAEIDRVAQELEVAAYADPVAIFGDDDTVLPVREWPEELRRNLAGIEVFERFEGKGSKRKFVGHLKKFKFYNKIAALEALAKLRQLGGYATVKDPSPGNSVN